MSCKGSRNSTPNATQMAAAVRVQRFDQFLDQPAVAAVCEHDGDLACLVKGMGKHGSAYRSIAVQPAVGGIGAAAQKHFFSGGQCIERSKQGAGMLCPDRTLVRQLCDFRN